MKSFYVLMIGVLLALSGHAQHERPDMCRSDELMKEHYKKHPGAFEEAQKFAQRKDQGAKTTATGYTIPVVFHVFGTDFAGASVDENTIVTALEKVNEDFNGLNDDYSTVSSLFQGRRATLDIQFKLAKIDPNGNPTSGVNFYAERSGFGNGGGYDSEIQQFAWDNYKYMNVYIMLDLYDDNSTTNSGVAWYPDTWMSDNDLARVVYNGRYLYGNTDKEFASVLTHEFGHWLNLAHTFDNECNAPGDNVDDTPATTSNYGTCNVSVEKCAGAGIPNGENYMDYSDCYKMYTQGQVARMTAALDHPTREPLWQESNLIATGVNDSSQPHLLYSASMLNEGEANDGSIDGSVTISGENGAEFAITGSLTEGTHFTTSNVPAGLSVQINVTSSTTAELSFSGSAASHANNDNVSDISFSFLNPAIAGGASSIQNPDYNGFSLNFIDPYEVIYEDIDDITVNSSTTWTFFYVSNGRFGCWYDNGKLRIETYTKPLVCEGTTRNISLLSSGTAISTSSNWVEGGAYPDEHDLRSSSYTTWDGQSGYVGFQFANANGNTLYGWLRITVNGSGSSFTLHDFAYYTKPEGTIHAGAKTPSEPPTASFSSTSQTISEGETVSFSDQSSGSPTAWSWSFPGGSPSTSTEQNPSVTYPTAGQYSVELTVTNAYGSNTKLIDEYINVISDSVTYCDAVSQRTRHEHIANVEVGSFTNTSGASAYSDYTDLTVDLVRGENDIKVTPGFPGLRYNQRIRVWIDYNRDGDFSDAGELVFDPGISSYAVSGVINVANSVPEGTKRVRIITRYRYAPEPCGPVDNGEVEDYTVRIPAKSVTYCDANAGTPSGQYIKRVKIGNQTKNSSYESNGYSDYSNETLSVNNSFALTVTPHNSWSGTAAKAWVDWNKDGDFNDNNEEILNDSGASNSYNTTVNTPSGVSGTVRIRVRVAYGEAPTACGSIYFSETEDYALEVSSAAGPTASVFDGEISVFPNPAENNQFQLQLPAHDNDLTIDVFSLQGVQVYRKRLTASPYNSTETIKLQKDVRGTFLVRITSGSDSVVKKVYFR